MNVAIIPARGGSVRIPRKNIRLFHGKPIIAYSIAAAKESGLFERVVVSTEDEEIADVAQNYGADVLMRLRHLADDPTVGTQEVTAHALKSIPCEFACCIYATAPTMTAEDLRHGFSRHGGYTYTYVPGWYYWGAAHSFLTVPQLESTSGLLINVGRTRHIDIDTPEDWQRAEQMYAGLHPEALCA